MAHFVFKLHVKEGSQVRISIGAANDQVLEYLKEWTFAI